MTMTRLFLILSMAFASPAVWSEEAEPAEELLAPAAAVLTLRSAQERALADNPSLAAVSLRIDQARQQVVQASSAYLPQASLNYRYANTELPDNVVEAQRLQSLVSILPSASQSASLGQFVAGVASPLRAFSNAAYSLSNGVDGYLSLQDDIDTYRASLEMGYVVFDGFGRLYTLKAAKSGKKETEAVFRDAQRLLLSAVAQAYYGIELSRENLSIAEADEGFNLRLLKDARAAKELGAGSLSDVLNFEVALRASQANVLTAEESRDNARIALAALMGLPTAYLSENVETAELETEQSEELDLPEPDDLLDSAIEHRPDLERARQSVERQRALAGRARSVFFPQVTAFASRAAELQDENDFDSDDYATTVGLEVSLDLFTGGRNWSQAKEAKLARRQSEYELSQAELDAFTEVRQNWVSLRQAQKQLVLQRTTEEYVRRNRDLVELEYRAGQVSLTRLTQAQRDLIAAQARLALARVGLALAWYDLRTATGENLLEFGLG